MQASRVCVQFLQDMHPVIGMHVWWLWFVVVSFLYVPHLYNPMGLSWGHLISDFSAWQNWIRSKVGSWVPNRTRQSGIHPSMCVCVCVLCVSEQA